MDEAGFEAAMEEQRRRARENSGFGADYNSLIKVDKRSDSPVMTIMNRRQTIAALHKEGQPVTELNAGDEGLVIPDKTAFYAESGGQVGDTGALSSNDAQFSVLDQK